MEKVDFVDESILYKMGLSASQAGLNFAQMIGSEERVPLAATA